MTATKLKLSVLQDRFAICALDKNSPLPDWAITDGMFSVTRTADELSVVCYESRVPEDVKSNTGWRCLKVEGPLDFSLTGILASLATSLANAGISIFALSTYETDYLLIKENNLNAAISALSEGGYLIAR